MANPLAPDELIAWLEKSAERHGERSDLACNIRDWMIGYIYVSDTSYFAKTDSDGTALLKDLPLGGYNVRVGHRRNQENSVTIAIQAVTPGSVAEIGDVANTCEQEGVAIPA